jgi:hypothetical protein
MKKVWISLIGVISVSMAGVDMKKPVPLAESLQISATEINKTLPAMLDSEVRHDSAEAQGHNLIFNYTLVNLTQEVMDEKTFTELMEADMKQQVCSDKDSQMMLKKGMKVAYNYADKNQQHITTFAYDAKSCGLMTNVEKIKQNILKIVDKKEQS